MATKTKIEWCDATWNPVTGCLHGCEYCYARRIAERFSAGWECECDFPILVEPARGQRIGKDGRVETTTQPYPYGFKPTFHKYKLKEIEHWKKSKRIFVCSMADLFGDWVPDNVIEEVMIATKSVPWHTYLFLTKNPKRYIDLVNKGLLPHKHWYGTSITKSKDEYAFFDDSVGYNWFLSIEPILEDLGALFPQSAKPKWIIVGAETGNRKNKVVPQKKWIDNIVNQCKEYNIPLFMKDSLIPIVGEENMLREFPKF